MDIRRFLSKYHSGMAVIGWGSWVVVFLATVYRSHMPVGLFDDHPLVADMILLIAVVLISLASAGEILSHERRIRAVEILQKALPLPVLIAYVAISIGFDSDSDITREIITLFILCIVLFNIKRGFDFFTGNREVVTCAEMKDLERRTDEAGLSYYEMMENAGTEAFGYICEEELDILEDLLIFCGKGNNGGDGFVVARKAREYGCDVTVVLACGPPTTPDAITNYELIKDKVRILAPEDDEELSEMLDECSHINSNERLSLLNKLRKKLHNLDKNINDEDYVIVDAIFGTGFHGVPEGIPKRSIEYMNNLKGVNRIYALDVPSGLPGDERDEAKEYFSAVYSDCTITFHAMKPVHKNRGPEISNHMKKVIVADIGITTTLENDLFFGDDPPANE